MIAPVAQQTAERGDGLAISRLRMTNFRSYEQAGLALDHAADDPARPVVLTGPNGAGKTNVLEALSYLASGRGLRGARLGDVARIGGDGGWAVSAHVESADGTSRIGTGIEPGSAQPATTGDDGDEDDDALAEPQGRFKRLVRIDGEPADTVNALGGVVSVAWLTPQMDRLFLDSTSVRRRFLDRLVTSIHPDHSRQISAYERVMRDRLRLLMEQGYRGADTTWLSVLEAKMAEHGVAIAAARLETVDLLGMQMGQLDDSPFPRAMVGVSGFLEQLLTDQPALAAEDAFKDRLAQDRKGDSARGRTATGVHRADLVVHHAPKAMPAAQCSTGEQKALLVGLIIAQARMRAAHSGLAPIILLDEIAAHLDEVRRRALFDLLPGLGSQAWLTGTDRSLFSDLDGRAEFRRVEGGKFLHDGQGML